MKNQEYHINFVDNNPENNIKRVLIYLYRLNSI